MDVDRHDGVSRGVHTRRPLLWTEQCGIQGGTQPLRLAVSLRVACRMVARASDAALVLRGITGRGRCLPVDDTVALADGVAARRPWPMHHRPAPRLVALDRNDLRRLAESAVGQPVNG